MEAKLRGKESELAAMYLSGIGTPELARRFCVSNSTIKNYLVKYGVLRRSNSEAQKLRPKATHCRKGHPRTADNVTKDGKCRQCESAYSSRRYIANKSLFYETHKKWVAENKEHAKRYDQDYRLQKHFGIRVEERDAMRTLQNNRCKICNKEFVKTPHTDHDHETGQVRDLLCDDCNLGLGRFFDSPELLDAAAAYLRRWKETIDGAQGQSR